MRSPGASVTIARLVSDFLPKVNDRRLRLRLPARLSVLTFRTWTLKIDSTAWRKSIAAVSCGIVGGEALLDLDYSEDSTAEVDMNVVMTGDDGLVEVQATAERTPLSRASLDDLLGLAASGIERLRASQDAAVHG